MCIDIHGMCQPNSRQKETWPSRAFKLDVTWYAQLYFDIQTKQASFLQTRWGCSRSKIENKKMGNASLPLLLLLLLLAERLWKKRAPFQQTRRLNVRVLCCLRNKAGKEYFLVFRAHLLQKISDNVSCLRRWSLPTFLAEIELFESPRKILDSCLW